MIYECQFPYLRKTQVRAVNNVEYPLYGSDEIIL
jgi:hypothetical protein